MTLVGVVVAATTAHFLLLVFIWGPLRDPVIWSSRPALSRIQHTNSTCCTIATTDDRRGGDFRSVTSTSRDSTRRPRRRSGSARDPQIRVPLSGYCLWRRLGN